MSGSSAGRAHVASRLAVPDWRPWLPVLLVGGLLLWFSFPAALTLHPFWTDYNYSHGYVVLVLVVFLVHAELRRGGAPAVRPSLAGAVCLLGSAGLVIAGQASTSALLAQSALPLLWLSGVWLAFGLPVALRLAPPIGYLYFAIPVWNSINEVLLNLTVTVVSGWIRAVGLPAFIEGNLIHLPSGTFEVAGGCSGLHYLIVALALGGFAGLLHDRGWRAFTLLAAIGAALALFANWLRVFIIVATGYATEMQHFLVVHDHYYFGWALFLVCATPLFFADRWLLGRHPAAPRPGGVRVEPDVAPYATAAIYLGAVVLAVGIAVQYRVHAAPEQARVAGALTLPAIAGWERIAEWQDTRRPRFDGPSAEAAHWYTASSARVGAYIADYAVQTQGREVVSWGNRPEGQTGRIVGDRRIDETASEVAFRELEILESDDARRLVWQVLQVGGKPVVAEFAAKVRQAVAALRGRRDAQVLVLTATCEPDCATARASLEAFAAVAAKSFLEAAERPSVLR